MNKVVLAILIAAVGMFSTLTAAPAVKVDQSSKRAVVETYLRAIAYEDFDAVWSLIPPIKGVNKVQMDIMKREYRKTFFSDFDASFVREIKKSINTPDWNKTVSENYQDFAPYIVKHNGKWYLDIWKMAGDEVEDIKIPPCPKRVDHSSKNSVVLSYFLGIYYEKDDIVLNTFAPSYRRTLKNPRGIAKGIKQFISKDAVVLAIKSLVSGEDVDGVAIPGVKFIKISGKWYLIFEEVK